MITMRVLPVVPALALIAAATLAVAPAARSQTGAEEDLDLSDRHGLAVRATVLVRPPGGRTTSYGTGWLLHQSGPIPLVVTNRHVVEPPIGRLHEIAYYQGTSENVVWSDARLSFVSSSIDLAFLIPLEPPPDRVRTLQMESEEVLRGERVVLAGHPNQLYFQTTEGVVTGVTPKYDAACGLGRNCIVVDAAGFQGSSGGPAINHRGRVVGMLWGLDAQHVRGSVDAYPGWVTNSSFAFLVHIRVIEDTLRAVAERRLGRR